MPSDNPAAEGGVRLQVIIEALPLLLDALRRNGFDAAVDNHLAACDLLLALAADGREPDPAELRAALGGLFCEDKDQQQRFPALFDAWYRRLAPEPPTPSPRPVPEKPRAFLSWLRLSRAAALSVWLGAGLLALGGTGAVWYLLQSPERPSSPSGGTPVESAPVSPDPAVATPDLGVLTRPRQPPEPVTASADQYPAWTPAARGAWLLFAFGWLLWLARRILLHRVVLERRRQRPGETFRLDQLRLAAAPGALFSAPQLADTWRQLRQFRSMRSGRLDEAATVERTLTAGGFFRPVYRDRQVPPAYLLLIDRQHAEDHAAGLADELRRAMHRENIQVQAFHYAEDPRFNVAVGQVDVERGPAALAGVYEDHGVLLVGDGEALFDEATGKIRPWVEEFARFQRRVMLTQGPMWRQGERAQALMDEGFELFPLTVAGLVQLGESPGEPGFDDPRDWPTPVRFSANPLRWLEPRSPSRARLKAAMDDLARYLGPEGWLLACATAAYPELHTSLTRALDVQLGLSGEDRGLRLRKLARLPWYRAGHLPDFLRIAWLRRLGRDQLQRVTDAYAALLEHRDNDSLRLPVAVPERRGIRAMLKAYLPGARRDEPLADQVFASVLQGRRPRRLEFALPRGLLAGLPTSGWRAAAMPMLAGLLIVPATIWLNAWAWSAWLGPAAESEGQRALFETNGQTRVSIAAPAALAPIAVALQSTLQRWGFGIDEEAPRVTSGDVAQGAEKPADPAGIPRVGARISYAPGARSAAEAVAGRVSYLYYGDLEVAFLTREAAPPGLVAVELLAPPRVFRDRLRDAPRPIAPEMVTVPAGDFRMGDLNDTGSADERPVREVRIARPFAIGKYEVTFDEYDAFAEATGRDKPDDLGWGRGRRPVVNVSWDDAAAYAEWLSAETGESYRLPTEAEWEYVARAGTDTDYWWGNEVGQDGKVWANCRGCGSEWDGRQTAPVGSFPANPFGLNDTAGNVWEWVEDCWHDNYDGAPGDGRAWLEADGGDCARRVTRGGAWNYGPWLLRASDRTGDTPVIRNFYLGFRLAQDLP